MEIVRTSLPDLIFMDIQLPDGNGLELTRRIKNLYPEVKVAVVTNYDVPEYRDAAHCYKADHYIAKDTFMALFGGILREALL